METFIAKQADKITGTLSGFDRLVFRGTLRMLAHCAGMMTYLHQVGVLLKEFGAHAEALTRQLREASEALAKQTGRPIHYLASAQSNKEAIARRIAVEDGISEGLICLLTAVEPCQSYVIDKDRAAKTIDLRLCQRKCLYLYHYQIHPLFGFMHARIQTWFPFAIQICLNGREWLSRSLAAAGLAAQRRENCFTWLKDPARAQQLMDEQLRSDWPTLLDGIAHSLNPQHEAMFADYPMPYYWTTHQSEWATDILFRSPAALAELYPPLVRHGLSTLRSPDVMRFLGRKVSPDGRLPPRFQAEVVSDVKQRPEGVRIKHRVGQNSVKMYDKQGSVLRVETTINDVDAFKTFRAPETRPEAEPSWQRMRKGVADLHRRAAVSQAANDRYLEAMAAVDDATPLGVLSARLCRPVCHKGRRVRALNPHAPGDAVLLGAISRGEFSLHGLRNRDLRGLLFPAAQSKAVEKRQAAAVSRKLALLRAHGVIRKVPRTHRYQLTSKGRVAVTALLSAQQASTQELMKRAA